LHNPPFFVKSKYTNGILEYCQKIRDWGTIYGFVDVRIDDNKKRGEKGRNLLRCYSIC